MKDITLIALSGLTLLALYPLGFLTTGVPYLCLFLVHIAVHMTAIGQSFTTIFDAFKGSRSGLAVLTLGVIIPLVCLLCLSALPVTGRDALIHHLAVPKMWIANGAITEIQWHEWSYYPMLLQLGFLGFLKLGLSQLTSIYHGSFLILSAALLIKCLPINSLSIKCPKTEQSSLTTWLALVLLFTTPILFRLGGVPYVDLPLCTYGLCIFYLLSKDHTAKGDIFLGIFLGLSAGVKYNGLLFSVVGLAACFGISIIRKRFSIRQFATVTALFFVIASPWYLKNWMLTGNPVFPLLDNIFPGDSPLSAVAASSLASTPPPKFFTETLQFLLLPFQMFIGGEDNNPAKFDGTVSPLFMFILLAPLLKTSRNLSLLGLFLFFGYGYTALELSGPRVRYLAPVLGIGIVLAALGAQWISERFTEKRVQLLMWGLIGIQFLSGAFYAGSTLNDRDALLYLQGGIKPIHYMKLHVQETLVADAANQKLPPDAKIYLLHTGNRYFLYDRAVENSGYFSDHLLLNWIKQSSKKGAERPIKHSLQSNGFTHIALHQDRYERSFNDYKARGILSVDELKLWNEFLNNDLELIYQIGPYIIGEIQ